MNRVAVNVNGAVSCDEKNEKALFAQRARALPPVSVPSLDAILAQVDGTGDAVAIDPPNVARGHFQTAANPARARTFDGARIFHALSLAAAACIAGLFLTHLGATYRAPCGTQDDAGTSSATAWIPGETCEEKIDERASTSSCADRTNALASLLDQPGACIAPRIVERENPSLSCENEVACRLVQ